MKNGVYFVLICAVAQNYLWSNLCTNLNCQHKRTSKFLTFVCAIAQFICPQQHFSLKQYFASQRIMHDEMRYLTGIFNSGAHLPSRRQTCFSSLFGTFAAPFINLCLHPGFPALHLEHKLEPSKRQRKGGIIRTPQTWHFGPKKRLFWQQQSCPAAPTTD